MSDIQSLAQTVLDGVATAEERGMVTRAVQNQLSKNLLDLLTASSESVNRLNSTLVRALNIYSQRIEAQLDQDMVSDELLLNTIDRIQNKQIQIAELYRKIVQSPKGLFSDDNISEEEKKVMRLFKSFKTVDERKRFLELCQSFLSPIESNGYDTTVS